MSSVSGAYRDRTTRAIRRESRKAGGSQRSSASLMRSDDSRLIFTGRHPTLAHLALPDVGPASLDALEEAFGIEGDAEPFRLRIDRVVGVHREDAPHSFPRTGTVPRPRRMTVEHGVLD